MGKMLIPNKKANFNYEILERFEAGISLSGTEVKSLIKSNGNIEEAFIIPKNNEFFIINMYVAPFKEGNQFNPEATRNRKLLMHKNEILKISNFISKNNATIIPLDVHFNHGKIKLNIGIAKRKNAHDKREDIKKRDDLRVMKNII